MLNSYVLKVRVLFDGEEVREHNKWFIITDEQGATRKTWTFTNLKEAISSLPDYAPIFTWNSHFFGKPFYGLEVDGYSFMWTSLSKKSHTLTIEYNYVPCEVSLERIIDYPNSALAIQYLKEHGLSVCPIGK